MDYVNEQEKQPFRYIGQRRPLVEGLEKVTGYARYTADLTLPHMLHIRPVLAQMANALINGIEKEAALAVPGVVAVLTADDLPTRDKVINTRNNAILAKERTLWVGQPVAVVVAETAEAAADAAEQVLVDYQPGAVVTSVEEAIRPDAPTVWPNGMPGRGGDMSALHGNTARGESAEEEVVLNNLNSSNRFQRGDVAAGFAESAVIIEKRYRINSVHQGYLEPHAVVVAPDPLGRSLTIYTGTQGMFDVRNEVAALLDLPQHAVVVKPMTLGGGFGAKYGIYEPLVAAVALALKQPVKLALTRSEDFLSSTPAPEVVIELKTGVKQDGTVTALQAKAYTNNAAFSYNHGGTIASLMAGTYQWQHVEIDTYEVHSFINPVGAYRAPGAPQAVFAIEGNMDEMAQQLGLDPLEFRYQNAVEDGGLTGSGQPWSSTLGLKAVLDVARNHPLWKDRQPGQGVGLAVGGWPNNAGNAEVLCRVDSDGRVRLDTGIVDVSGVKSSLVLIAAEALGVDPDSIELAQGDTDGVYGPWSGGSRVTYAMATAVHQAAADAHQQLLQIAADEFEAAVEDLEIVEGEARVVGVPDRRIPIAKLARRGRYAANHVPVIGRGQSSLDQSGPGFVAHLIQVAVDEETGEVRPLRYVAIQDVGLALNPLMVEGQMHGGAVQSLGMGLCEHFAHDREGQLLTGTLMDYALPRIDNSPEVEAIIVEHPNPFGFHGIRGMAEPALTAGPAALVSAIRDATGVHITETPVRAEQLWQALQRQQ